MMKWTSWKLVLVSFLLSLATVACAVDGGDGENGVRVEALQGLDREETWQLYEWYVEHGFTPCDPPPDPWSPFVQYGCCENVHGFEHEIVPSESYDE
jgi:hypothetical protein